MDNRNNENGFIEMVQHSRKLIYRIEIIWMTFWQLNRYELLSSNFAENCSIAFQSKWIEISQISQKSILINFNWKKKRGELIVVSFGPHIVHNFECDKKHSLWPQFIHFHSRCSRFVRTFTCKLKIVLVYVIF